DGGDAVRHLQSKAKANRGTIIEDVKGELLKFHLLGETGNGRGDIREGVLVSIGVRHVGLPETGKIGRHQTKVPGQERYQVAKHVTRTGKSVQQKQRRSVRTPGLAVKDLHAINCNITVTNIHNSFQPLAGIAELITLSLELLR